MIQLFAGIRTDGTLLYISEAKSGAQMDCFCPVCRSPLIAKKGTLKEWHFAHQALQERPECAVGAVNLLRHICRAEILSNQILRLPSFSLVCKRDGPISTLSSSYNRDAVEGKIARTRPDALPDRPFAVLETSTGSLALFCMANGLQPPGENWFFDGVECVGLVHFACSLPTNFSALKSPETALAYVRANMCSDWRLKSEGLQSSMELQEGLEKALDNELTEQWKAHRIRALSSKWAPTARRMGFLPSNTPERLGAHQAQVGQIQVVKDEIQQSIESHVVDDSEAAARIAKFNKRSQLVQMVQLEFKNGSKWTFHLYEGTGRLKPIEPIGGVIPNWEFHFPPSQVGEVDMRLRMYRSHGRQTDECVGFLARHAVAFLVQA